MTESRSMTADDTGAGIQTSRRDGHAGARTAGSSVASPSTEGGHCDAAIERGEVTVEGRDEPAPLAVRVTHVFGREDGAWRIIHRHGDPITQITPAAAVLRE